MAPSPAAANIITRSHEVKGLVDLVQSGTEQHSIGIEQIARTVAQIGQTTQQTAAGAEESAAAGAEMTAQAEALRGQAQMLGALVGAAESPARNRERERAARMNSER